MTLVIVAIVNAGICHINIQGFLGILASMDILRDLASKTHEGLFYKVSQNDDRVHAWIEMIQGTNHLKKTKLNSFL